MSWYIRTVESCKCRSDGLSNLNCLEFKSINSSTTTCDEIQRVKNLKHATYYELNSMPAYM